ncbi:MAG TPA: YfbM family protein [Gemmataceae bacterium]|nr:YfbM family protein [Gemmataceae bacterium]
MTARFVPVTVAQLDDVIRGRLDPITLLFPDDNSPSEALDIDKSWHAIHYLLTGVPWDGEPPLCHVILGGEPAGEDTGFGPARCLRPDEVATIASALERVTPDSLRQRFGDGTALTQADIYPGVWHGGADAFDSVLTYFTELVKLYRQTAASGRAMLLFLV